MPPAKLIINRIDILNGFKGGSFMDFKPAEKVPAEQQMEARKAHPEIKTEDTPVKTEEEREAEPSAPKPPPNEVENKDKAPPPKPLTTTLTVRTPQKILAPNTPDNNANQSNEAAKLQLALQSDDKSTPKSCSSGSENALGTPLSRKHMCYKTYSPEDLIAALRTYVKTRKSGKYVSIRHLSRISGIPYATLRDHISGRKCGVARKEIQDVLNDLVKANDIYKENKQVKFESSPKSVAAIDANSVLRSCQELCKLSPTSVLNPSSPSTSAVSIAGYQSFLRYYWSDLELSKFNQHMLNVHVNCMQQLAVMENVKKVTGDSNLSNCESFKSLMMQSASALTTNLQERIKYLEGNVTLSHAMKAIQNGIVIGFLSSFGSAAECIDPQCLRWMCDARYSFLIYSTILRLSKSQKHVKYLSLEKIKRIDQLRKCWVSDEAGINLSVKQLQDKLLLSQQSNDVLGVVNLTVQLIKLFQRADELRILILNQTEQILSHYEIILPFRCELMQQIADASNSNYVQGSVMNAYTSKLRQVMKFCDL